MTFHTVPDVAKLLKLSISQVYALLDSGRLRCHRFTTKRNGGVRISQTQMDEYLKATESEGKPVEEPALRHLR